MNLINKLIDLFYHRFTDWRVGVKAWKDGEWYFRARKSWGKSDAFIVWCSKSRICEYDIISENSDFKVYFKWDRTIDDAVSKLKQEINFGY
jgi:hypothetical protein